MPAVRWIPCRRSAVTPKQARKSVAGGSERAGIFCCLCLSDAVVADAVFGILFPIGVQNVVERDLRSEFPDAVVELRPDAARGA